MREQHLLKQRFVFGFLSLLVELKVFKKIKVSFLMVGHTHEDIDQVFSRFSVWLNKHAALTLPSLMHAFENCFQPKPHAIETNNVYDVTNWIKDFINPISGHSQPHTFKFVLGDDGKAKFLYKKWANDKVWLECNGTEKNILKSVPNTCPSFMPMNEEQIDVDRLKADVYKVSKQYGCDKDGWWTSFFTDIVTAISNQEIHPQSTWPLHEIVRAKENRRTEETMIIEPSSNQSNVHIDGLSDEDTVPLIILGKKEKEKEKNKQMEREVPAVGNFALTNVPKYAGEWPQLGKVLRIIDGTAQIHWYKGSKTGPWAPCTKAVPGTRGKREAWCETVQLQDIWCHGFNLTHAQKLPLKIKEKVDSFTDF